MEELVRQEAEKQTNNTQESPKDVGPRWDNHSTTTRLEVTGIRGNCRGVHCVHTCLYHQEYIRKRKEYQTPV